MLDRLKEIGFVVAEDGTLCPPVIDKDCLRQIHKPAWQREAIAHWNWLRQHLPRYLHFFAHGHEVTPERVDPSLVEVTTQQHRHLFRIAQWLWSIPLSKGYGRRLRFLVVDQANGKLIGLLALQSPPLSFPAIAKQVKVGISSVEYPQYS